MDYTLMLEFRDLLIEAAGHRRPPVRDIDRADLSEHVSVLVKANDPQDRRAACLVGSAGELAC
jgi:hypothetical protein